MLFAFALNDDTSQQIMHQRERPIKIGGAFDALCIAPLLLIAIAGSPFSDAWIEGIFSLVNSAVGSD